MELLLVNGVFPPDEYGGAEHYIQRVATALQSRGTDVAILTTTPNEGRNSRGVQAETYEGIPTYRFSPMNLSHRSNGTGGNIVTKAIWHQFDTINPHAQRIVREFLNRHQPATVHTHNFMGITAATGRAIAESSARHVHTLHDYSLICPKSNLLRDMTVPGDEVTVCEEPPTPCRIYASAKRRMIGQPDVVIGPSQHIIDVHTRHGFFQDVTTTCIRHGVGSCAESIPETTTDSVLYVGKHLKAKGLETLFAAARQCREVTIHLCGTGPIDERSQVVADQLQNVIYHGYVSEERLDELRQKVAATIVPSLWMENAPLVIYESFAAGVPVIGADIGGIPELVTPDRGISFPPGDEKALTDAIQKIVDNSTVQRRTNALSWAKDHSMEEHLNALLETYELE
ncbi:glycosyltransferase family 4 protein [Haloarchaeobius sp. TZWSO28]|uniref:glycosyltransferase family 4 protein n=1 Tax=Haloarchaeobius sp. TZWSO28 TaxID=3446119 RepID=UPI003EBA890C